MTLFLSLDEGGMNSISVESAAARSLAQGQSSLSSVSFAALMGGAKTEAKGNLAFPPRVVNPSLAERSLKAARASRDAAALYMYPPPPAPSSSYFMFFKLFHQCIK